MAERLDGTQGPRQILPNQAANKQEAQRRADRIRAFRAELEQLLQEGALELQGAQRARLDEHLDRTLTELAGRYDIDVSTAQKQFSIGMLVTATLGGLAFCMALVMFFYRYWGVFTATQQCLLLAIAPLLLLFATHWVSRRDRAGYYTGLLGLVACAAFGLNLTVLGTIFNLVPTPNAIFGWAVFALAVAYAYQLRLPLIGGLIAAAFYIASLVTTLAGGFWGAFGDRPENFAVAGIGLVAAPLVLSHRSRQSFPMVYRIIGMLLFFATLEVMMHAKGQSYLPLAAPVLTVAYQLLAFGSAAAVIWLGLRRRLADLVNIASAFFALFLFDRLIDWWWDWMPRYLFFLIVGGIAVLLLLIFRRLRSRAARKEAA
jgi:uncharacterized membrane protein